MTDLEYIERNEDSLTKFVPTKKDLVDLANALADAYVNIDFVLGINFGRSLAVERDYTEYRLSRILRFLPERESEIIKELNRRLEENSAAHHLYLEGGYEALKRYDEEEEAKDQQRREAARNAPSQ